MAAQMRRQQQRQCAQRRAVAAAPLLRTPRSDGFTPSADAPRRAAVPREYETILTEEAARSAGSRCCEQAPLTAFDTETTSLDYSRGAHRRHVVLHRGRARPPICRWRIAMPARPISCDLDAASRDLKPWLENPQRRQGRPPPEVRRACAAQSRHPARRHAARFDAGILCAQQRGHAPRHGFGREALPRRRHHQVRRRGRQGREADRLRPGRHRDGIELCGGRCRRHAADARGALAAAARRSRSCGRCTRKSSSRCRWCCWRWNSAACCSMRALLRKQSSELGAKLVELQTRRRMRRPAANSISIRRSSCSRSCSRSSSCR